MNPKFKIGEIVTNGKETGEIIAILNCEELERIQIAGAIWGYIILHNRFSYTTSLEVEQYLFQAEQ